VTDGLDLVLDVLLAVGLAGSAGIALLHPRRTAAVVAFLVFGILLAVVWARLGAPDIALAEAAIGAGVTSALLLDAVAGRDRPMAPGGRRSVAVAGAVLAGVVAALVLWAISRLPAAGSRPGPGAEVLDRLDQTGVAHGVTAVLLDFRSLDTLLEVAVLLVAALGALSLQPDEGIAAVPAPHDAPVVLDLLVRQLAPLLVLLVGWVVVAGSTRPGGAFQAGAVLAGTLLLLRLAGRPAAVPTGRTLRPLLVSGLAAFLVIAVGTALLGDGWLVLDPAWAGTAILAVEVVLAVAIGVTLAAVFVANQPTATGRGDGLGEGST
jgi:multisubunit Na+/H+ antiporter MnhB subunit